MKTYTLKTAGEVLAVDPTTVQALIDDLTIPAAKFGRAWVILEDDLYAYVRRRIDEQTAERVEAAAMGVKRRQRTEASATTRYRRRLMPDLDAHLMANDMVAQ